MRYNTLIVALVAVLAVASFERVGRAQGNNQPPSTASITFGTKVADLMTATLHEAGVAMFSAACGRDFARDNDLLPELALERLSLALR